MDRQIVVGTDGSVYSQHTLRWAAQEATRQGGALRIVHGYDTWVDGWLRNPTQARQAAREYAERLVADAVELVRQGWPGLAVTGDAVPGWAAPVLLDAARTAALTVVGNRGGGGFADLLLGAVGQRVATHAESPVVVVRGRTEESGGPVVVGVDGSFAAHQALGTAFEAAAERGCALVVVQAYQLPSPTLAIDALAPPSYVRAEIEAECHKSLEQTLTPWRDKYPDVSVQVLVVEGGAARVLIQLSHTARLVVVGSRGHGQVAGTLLGSVGLQLSHHAGCPVMIVRPRVAA